VRFDAIDVDRLQKIEEGAERIGTFAKDLLAYVRPSKGHKTFLDVNELFEQALSFCEHPLKSAGASVERCFHVNLPTVYGVRDQLLQVGVNLISNAAQSLPETGGVVRVRTWPKEDNAVGIAVSDDGRGIREPDKTQVFEPFFSTKEPGKGTGLGLSIVRDIVYSHGGQISFHSQLGTGTTFLLTLPVTHPEERVEGPLRDLT